MGRQKRIERKDSRKDEHENSEQGRYASDDASSGEKANLQSFPICALLENQTLGAPNDAEDKAHHSEAVAAGRGRIRVELKGKIPRLRVDSQTLQRIK